MRSNESSLKYLKELIKPMVLIEAQSSLYELKEDKVAPSSLY